MCYQDRQSEFDYEKRILLAKLNSGEITAREYTQLVRRLADKWKI